MDENTGQGSGEMKRINCYLSINSRTWRQEHYETASGDARTRARILREAGYNVVSSPMGFQVTPVGSVRMTMLTILNPDDNLPAVNEIRVAV